MQTPILLLLRPINRLLGRTGDTIGPRCYSLSLSPTIDFYASRVRSHRRNIERYCRLLATELTNLQRQNLHKRIAEEYVHLERLEKSQTKPQIDVVASTDQI